jgi:hypothetical protein
MSDLSTISSETRAEGLGRRIVESKWLGGSIVAWAGVAITVLGHAVQYGTTQATVQGQVGSLKYEVTRNREEANDRVKSIEGNVSNLYTSMAAMHSIKIDVEVIKSRIQSTDDTLRRLESQMLRIERRDRQDRPGAPMR